MDYLSLCLARISRLSEPEGLRKKISPPSSQDMWDASFTRDGRLPQLTDVSTPGSPETFTAIRKSWPKEIRLRLPRCLGSPGK